MKLRKYTINKPSKNLIVRKLIRLLVIASIFGAYKTGYRTSNQVVLIARKARKVGYDKTNLSRSICIILYSQKFQNPKTQ